MSDMPVSLTASHISTPGRGEIVRIEARDRVRIMARLDMSPADFAAMVLGQEIAAAFSPVRVG